MVFQMIRNIAHVFIFSDRLVKKKKIKNKLYIYYMRKNLREQA